MNQDSRIQEAYFWKITSPNIPQLTWGFLISVTDVVIPYPNVLEAYVTPFPWKLIGVFQLCSRLNRFFNSMEPKELITSILEDTGSTGCYLNVFNHLTPLNDGSFALWTPTKNFSVIIRTDYSTWENQATIYFCIDA